MRIKGFQGAKNIPSKAPRGKDHPSAIPSMQT